MKYFWITFLILVAFCLIFKNLFSHLEATDEELGHELLFLNDKSEA